MHLRKNVGCLVMLASLGLISSANADSCALPDPGDIGESSSGTGDEFFGKNYWSWCNSSDLADLSSTYGMRKKYWDEGFGWDDACDTDRPMGRMMTTIVAFHNGAPTLELVDPLNPFSGWKNYSILHWGPAWAVNKIDNLKVFCASRRKDGTAYAYTSLGVVRVYVPNYFYSRSHPTDLTDVAIRNVTARAGTLMHETIHLKGKVHKKDGKDKAWGGNGPWDYHVSWLAYYSDQAINTPTGQKCLAAKQANVLLGRAYIEENRLSVNDDVCDPNP